MSNGKYPSIPDYSTISRGITRWNIKISDNKIDESKDDYIVIVHFLFDYRKSFFANDIIHFNKGNRHNLIQFARIII